MAHRTVLILLAIACPIHDTSRSKRGSSALDHVGHQLALIHLQGVVCGLQGQQLVKRRVLLAQLAGGVCEGAVEVLAPMGTALVLAEGQLLIRLVDELVLGRSSKGGLATHGQAL